MEKSEKRCLTGMDYHRYRVFGLTPEDYQEMLAQQNNVCAICGRRDRNKSLAVDHNHTTGKVRGLLCGRCNTGLGQFQDDIRLLASAIVYLEDNGASYYQ